MIINLSSHLFLSTWNWKWISTETLNFNLYAQGEYLTFQNDLYLNNIRMVAIILLGSYSSTESKYCVGLSGTLIK